jgi:hypothetical protein
MLVSRPQYAYRGDASVCVVRDGAIVAAADVSEARLGHARDYVEGMWLIVQQPEPDDYVLATGENRCRNSLKRPSHASA